MFGPLWRLFTKSGSVRRAPARRRSTLLQVESLQDRIVPAAPVSLNQGHALIIQGSSGADQVTVAQTGSTIQVRDDGATYRFSAADVQSIRFSGQAGNDSFANSAQRPVIADGGAGNDTLTGGNGNDRINGGAGNDVLNGRGGNDVLVGGSGNNTISGGSGNDTCVGGPGHNHINGGPGSNTIQDGGSGASQGSSQAPTLHADLTGSSSAVGRVGVSLDGQTLTAFHLDVHQAPASQTLSVFIDNSQTSVATLQTDANGNGKLSLSAPSFQVQDGSVVTIRDAMGNTILQGTLSATNLQAS